jgi:D-alanine-D-alanine ligase
VHFRSAGANSNGPVLATYRVKWDAAYQEKWGIEFGFADIGAELAANIGRVCKRVYRVLQLQDYGRVDLRVTPEGRIVILEVNPNPDIAYGEEVAESAEKSGIPYPRLIDRILRLALRRYGA